MYYTNVFTNTAEERFRSMHSEIIMYFQCIEHDMKRIYSGMSADDYYDCMDMLDGKNWGAILNKLKKLDYSDNDPFFSEEDYAQLDAIREQRNYWCHQCYLDYVYIRNDIERQATLERLCRRLENEKNRAYKLHRKMQDIFLEDFCE